MQPGKPLPGIRSLMAVINSVGVGRGSKSVGEFTYRYTRGRTIASRRITKNTSKTPAQVGRRGAFGSFVWMFSPYKWFFSDGYEKTKHGSSFNQFVHVNRELLGKSPYNSEVNKKLIPNGARLYSLLNAILDKSSPHLKYATYGSLGASVLSYSLDDSFYRASSLRVEIFTDDFKDISLVLLGVNSMVIHILKIFHYTRTLKFLLFLILRNIQKATILLPLFLTWISVRFFLLFKHDPSLKLLPLLTKI